MKIAIVIGHTNKSKGACSPFSIPCEFDFNKEIAIKLAALDCRITIFENTSYVNGYYEMVKSTAYEINKIGFDLVLELHYNAADPAAHGSEALYYFKNKKAKSMAEYFSYLMALKMGYKNRGGKALLNKDDRGFWAVYLPNPTAIILEPFFGSNKNDVKLMNKDKYASVILETIKKYESL